MKTPPMYLNYGLRPRPVRDLLRKFEGKEKVVKNASGVKNVWVNRLGIPDLVKGFIYKNHE